MDDFSNFADNIAQVTGAAPTRSATTASSSYSPPGFPTVSPEVQNSRDQERIGILNQELARQVDPNEQASLKRQIVSTQQGMQKTPQQNVYDPNAFNADGIVAAANGQGAYAQATPVGQQVITDSTKMPGVYNIPGNGGKQQWLADQQQKISAAASQAQSAAEDTQSWKDKYGDTLGGLLATVAPAGREALSSAKGAVEAGLAGASSTLLTPIAAIGKLIGDNTGGSATGDKYADTVLSKAYQPQSEKGQEYTQALSDASGNLLGAMPLGNQLGSLHMAPIADTAASLVAKGEAEGTKIAPVESSFGKGSVGAAEVMNPDRGTNLAPDNAADVTAINTQPVTSAPTLANNAGVLNRVGLDTVRKSALTHDGMSAATEYQMGKYDEPAGIAARQQFQDEKTALENHTESIMQGADVPLGMDLDTRTDRGHGIMDALDSMKENIDTGWKNLYAQADTESQAAGSKVNMNSTHDYVGGDKADFLGTTEGEALLKGVTARMKSLGMVDSEGNAQPVTVKQAEQLKQYLGNQWQPRTNKLIGGLKDAIDNDVISSGSPDIYAKARNLRAQRSAIFDDPEGISKIMDSEGPSGLNRKVNFEDIGTAISNMPVDQFNHVINVLRAAPDELQPQAQAAIQNIQGGMVSKLLDAGTHTTGGKPLEIWGNSNVNKYINNNNGKLANLFNEEQVGKISDLRDAGNILSVNPSYPGASAQAANAVRKGMMADIIGKGLTGAGGGIGTMLGAPVLGTMLGNAVGERIGSGLGQAKALKSFKAGTTKISDITP